MDGRSIAVITHRPEWWREQWGAGSDRFIHRYWDSTWLEQLVTYPYPERLALIVDYPIPMHILPQLTRLARAGVDVRFDFMRPSEDQLAYGRSLI